MLTAKQLARRLSALNCSEVARVANVHPRTVYRLRHQRNQPTLDTANRVFAAIQQIEQRKAA